MATYPIILNPAGYVPQAPSALRAQVDAAVSAVDPGYTSTLPGSLIEDMLSTETYSLAQMDSAIAVVIAAISPYVANPYILSLLGNMLGIVIGEASNTSVYVTFYGPPGFIIAKGFTVSDGTYQYTVQDGGVIAANGQSDQLYCLGVQSGSWAVPIGSVTQLVTSVPSVIALSCSNLVTGVPATSAEGESSYRARVLQANLAASQGMTRYLRTLLQAVPGVVSRLVSVAQVESGQLEVICGGGDPYRVGYAIYYADFAFNMLASSVLTIANISQASPAVVSLNLLPNYQSGQRVTITGVVGMTELNGNAYYANNVPNQPYEIALYQDQGLTIPINTTGYRPYVSGGVVGPNLRNISVSLIDYPDSYAVKFVNPPKQSVTMAVTWNTTDPNFVNPNAVAQLASQPLLNYINGIVVGQPINVLQMNSIFTAAVASVIPAPYLTRLVFEVNIDGVGVSPESGTYEILSDPESYFSISAAGLSIAQG